MVKLFCSHHFPIHIIIDNIFNQSSSISLMMKAKSRAEGTDIKRSADRSGKQDDDEYQPKTALGRKLMSIREKIIASREPLLNWEEIEREVAERRGEAD